MHRGYDSGESIGNLRMALPTVLSSLSPNEVDILKVDFGALYRAYTPLCQRLTAILTDNRP